MSDWKVFADKIEIFPHPNADKMQLGRIGSFQVVVGKGLYKSGDIVVFAPKRSILPPDLRQHFVNEQTGKSYLRGPNEDRVGSIRLRGEESEGVILPKEWVMKTHIGWETSIPMEVDISSALGIVEYVPEIHSVNSRTRGSQDGDVVQRVDEVVQMDRFVRHDCEQFRIFEKEFTLGEQVIVTEKVHGTQISILKDKHGNIAVTSKGRAEKNLVLRRTPKRSLWKGRTLFLKMRNFVRVLFTKSTIVNEYWKYAEDSGIISFVKKPEFEGLEVQVIGEVIGNGIQTGFHYGQAKPVVKVFRLILDTIDISHLRYLDLPIIPNPVLDWVPILYRGPYDPEKIIPLADGMETVSGIELHIREGIVISPIPLRKSLYNATLFVKIVSKKFKLDEDGEEIR